VPSTPMACRASLVILTRWVVTLLCLYTSWWASRDRRRCPCPSLWGRLMIGAVDKSQRHHSCGGGWSLGCIWTICCSLESDDGVDVGQRQWRWGRHGDFGGALVDQLNSRYFNTE
jgi:hypothetical protein